MSRSSKQISSSDFWEPKRILRYVESHSSSTQVIRVKTELGDGFLKSLGNPEGEHALACEWVGTQLAKWFHLPTFQFGLIVVTDEMQLPFYEVSKGGAKPGPAFITKSDEGETWGGTERELKRLFNPRDISRLVVFDTWVRNRDRYFHQVGKPARKRFENVFLSEDTVEGHVLLRAMDHTHIFSSVGELLPKHLGREQIQDENVYGLFPQFRAFLEEDAIIEALAKMRQIKKAEIEAMIHTIPAEWDVSQATRTALADFILKRANYLSDEVTENKHLRPRILKLLYPQGVLFPPA